MPWAFQTVSEVKAVGASAVEKVLYLEFFLRLVAPEGFRGRQLSAAFVLVRGKARNSSFEFRWFLGQYLFAPRDVDLAH